MRMKQCSLYASTMASINFYISKFACFPTYLNLGLFSSTFFHIFSRDSFAAHRDYMHHIFSDHLGQDFPFKHGGERFPDQRGRPDSRVALRDNHKVWVYIVLQIT